MTFLHCLSSLMSWEERKTYSDSWCVCNDFSFSADLSIFVSYLISFLLKIVHSPSKEYLRLPMFGCLLVSSSSWQHHHHDHQREQFLHCLSQRQLSCRHRDSLSTWDQNNRRNIINLSLFDDVPCKGRKIYTLIQHLLFLSKNCDHWYDVRTGKEAWGSNNSGSEAKTNWLPKQAKSDTRLAIFNLRKEMRYRDRKMLYPSSSPDDLPSQCLTLLTLLTLEKTLIGTSVQHEIFVFVVCFPRHASCFPFLRTRYSFDLLSLSLFSLRCIHSNMILETTCSLRFIITVIIINS